MGYIVCDSCGGYYELQAGESADDFDKCQCGGNLNFTNTVPQDDDHDNMDSNSASGKKSLLICPHCLKHHDSGIFCSNCGSDLISVEKGNGLFKSEKYSKKKQISLENRLESRYKERIPQKIPPRSPKRIPKRIPPTTFHSGEDMDKDSSVIKRILNRISWVGVVLGTVFYIISTIIVAILLILFVFSQMDYTNPYSYDPQPGLVLFGTILMVGVMIVISSISGALAGYMSKSRDYNDGILNGFIVGLAAIAIMFGSGGSDAVSLAAIIILGGLTAAGGLLGIFIRKKRDY